MMQPAANKGKMLYEAREDKSLKERQQYRNAIISKTKGPSKFTEYPYEATTTL